MNQISPELLQMVGEAVGHMRQSADQKKRLQRMAAFGVLRALVGRPLTELGDEPGESIIELTDEEALSQLNEVLNATNDFVVVETLVLMLMASSGIMKTERLLEAITIATKRRDEIRRLSFEEIKNTILRVIEQARSWSLKRLANVVISDLDACINNALSAGQIIESQVAELRSMIPRGEIPSNRFVDLSTGQPYTNDGSMRILTQSGADNQNNLTWQ